MTTSAVVDWSEVEVLEPPATREAGCWFQRLVPEQQIEVVAANERGFSLAEIAWVLKKWGEGMSPSSLSLHFRGGCACHR